MKLGLQVNNFTWEGRPQSIGPIYGSIGRKAEEAGFDSLWVMDHMYQIPGLGAAEEPMLEGYSALAFIAGQTEKIKLGTMVTGVTYRHPGVLVKTVTTLDVLSGGRAYFGIGAAWFEREHLGLGIPFPPLKERFERLEETLQIAHLMWSGEVTQYNGKHYQLGETLNSPQVLSQPHPPVMIGGTGETKTLRFVAKYGDACNIFLRLGDEELKRKLDVLREHCANENRPYTDIEKTSLDRVRVTKDGADGSMSFQQALDYFAHIGELGFDQAIFSMPNVSQPDAFEIFHELAPEIHKLPVAGR